MKKLLVGLIGLFLFSTAFAEQTIYFIRHGEKPELGLGQINCQGFNRAVALVGVIDEKLGKPDFIIASNPSKQKNDKGVIYDYIRPLATVEPTAIYYGMPVNTQIGFEQEDELFAELLRPQYENKKVLVAWEHRIAEWVTRKFVNTYGDKSTVPRWDSPDFDSIYIVSIDKTEGAIKAKFRIEKQNLDGLSKTCDFIKRKEK